MCANMSLKTKFKCWNSNLIPKVWWQPDFLKWFPYIFEIINKRHPDNQSNSNQRCAMNIYFWNRSRYTVPFSKLLKNICTSGKLCSYLETTSSTRWTVKFSRARQRLGNFIESFHLQTRSPQKSSISASCSSWRTEQKRGHLRHGWSTISKSLSVLKRTPCSAFFWGDRIRNAMIQQWTKVIDIAHRISWSDNGLPIWLIGVEVNGSLSGDSVLAKVV